MSVRYRAAEALWRLGDLRGTPVLIDGLREDMLLYPARMLIDILSEMKDRAVLELLIGALSSQSADVRYGAATALGEMGNAESAPALVSTVRDKFREVAEAAAYALTQLKDNNTPPLLIDALNDQYRAVRSLAAQSLGTIGDPMAIEPLISALGDEYRAVRDSARYALSRMTGLDLGRNRRLWQKWWEENRADGENND